VRFKVFGYPRLKPPWAPSYVDESLYRILNKLGCSNGHSSRIGHVYHGHAR